MISIKTAEHYTWGQGCDGWHLVRTPELSVIQERMPDGASEVRHLHVRARQFFFVLSGRLTIELEGARHELSVGEGLEIPPGSAHQAVNESGGDTSFIVVSQPPSHGDKLAAKGCTAEIAREFAGHLPQSQRRVRHR
ncbi:MAG: cupin domain-containing protein [Acidobacteriota bacterium]|nr:cupin domain-containing protein [Acidobacteriota bacterium]